MSFFVILDYEVMMLGKYIRKSLIDQVDGNCIGLNLDTNFTSYSVLKRFPYSKRLVSSMVSLDVITFQNLSHVEGFVDIAKSMF
jgi:trehalose-6-phosphate synthase